MPARQTLKKCVSLLVAVLGCLFTISSHAGLVQVTFTDTVEDCATRSSIPGEFAPGTRVGYYNPCNPPAGHPLPTVTVGDNFMASMILGTDDATGQVTSVTDLLFSPPNIPLRFAALPGTAVFHDLRLLEGMLTGRMDTNFRIPGVDPGLPPRATPDRISHIFEGTLGSYSAATPTVNGVLVRGHLGRTVITSVRPIDPPIDVPEPGVLGLLGAGTIGLLISRRRQRTRLIA